MRIILDLKEQPATLIHLILNMCTGLLDQKRRPHIKRSYRTHVLNATPSFISPHPPVSTAATRACAEERLPERRERWGAAAVWKPSQS